MTSFRAPTIAVVTVHVRGCSGIQGAPSWYPALVKSGDALFDEYVDKYLPSSTAQVKEPLIARFGKEINLAMRLLASPCRPRPTAARPASA